MSDVARKNRAEERQRMITVRFTTLDDESDPWPIRGAAAMSLVTTVTRDAWNLAGLPWPSYERQNIPVRFIPKIEEED